MQGSCVGMTDYSIQSPKQISDDIKYWISFCKKTQNNLGKTIEELKKSGYWQQIGYNFRSECATVLSVTVNTLVSDFILIVDDIDSNAINSRTIELLKNISDVVQEVYRNIVFTFKEDDGWKQYGDNNFIKAESIYCELRDLFGTMLDAGNMIPRLRNYINNGVFMQQNIQNQTNVNGTNNGNIVQASGQSKVIVSKSKDKESERDSKLLWKIAIPIAIGIIVTVVGGIILAKILGN